MTDDTVTARAKRLVALMRGKYGKPTPAPGYVLLPDGLDGESDPVVMRTNHETGETTVEPWDGEEM